MHQTLDRIETFARNAPKRIALVPETGPITYAEMWAGARATAGLLLDAPGKGAPVCLFGKSLAVHVQMGLGCLLANRSFVSLGPRIPEDALGHMVRMAASELCLTSDTEGEAIAQAHGVQSISYADTLAAPQPKTLPDLDPNALSLLQNTSGSTSLPKLVGVDQRTLQKFTLLHHDLGQLQEEDRYPLFGETWFDNFFGVLHAGGRLEEYDLKERGAEGLSQWVRARKISNMHTFTAAFRTLAETTSEPLPDLRVVRLFGEVMNRADIEAFERICLPGSTFMNTFGATECTCMAQYDHPHGATPPSGNVPAGTPAIPGALRITGQVGDNPRAEIPQGTTGVIEVHSEFLAEGYLNNPSKSEGVFWSENGTRVLSTGDLGYFDAEGVLHVVGRADDQVKVRGYSVRYSEVEAPVEELPEVAEVAVTSIVSPHGTRQLAMHFVAEPEAEVSPAKVRDHLASNLPAYMVPNYVLEQEALPKTPSGKIKRSALPNPLEDESLRTTVSRSGWSEAERRVADVWSDVLGHAGFDRGDDFFDIGGDSLQAMMMVVRCEEAFDCRLGYESLALEGASVAQIADRLLNGPSIALAGGMVRLREGNGVQPLHILPVERGEFSDWLFVLQSMRQDREVLGVHVRDETQRHDFHALSVEALAQRAARNIMERDPDGAHLIAGFSAGANTAIETVRAIQDMGGKVAGLILVDPPVKRYEDYRWTWQARRIGSALAKSGSLSLAARRAAHFWLGRATDELEIADERTFWRYRPRPLKVPPTLVIEAEVRNPNRAAKATFWDAMLNGSVTRWAGPADHMNLLREPCSQLTTVRIEEWIATLRQA